MKRTEETYRIAPLVYGGMAVVTDCGNEMYSVNNDPMKFHGRLCSKCFMKNIYSTMWMRGTKEANKLLGYEVEE